MNDMQLDDPELLHAFHNILNSNPGIGADKAHEISALLTHLVQSVEELKHLVLSPKRVVRDHSGRISHVETATR